METRRVVVTGAAGITALGSDWPTILEGLKAQRNCVRFQPSFAAVKGLNSHVGAPAAPFELPPHYTRKRTRTMGRNALLAVRSTELALEQAGLLGDEVLKSGRAGVSYGSSSGSSDALEEMSHVRVSQSARKINATSYVRMMSHTAAANISMFFGLKGRVIPTISACTAGSQGVGYGFEAVRYGLQDVMVVGGSEELCPSHAGVFDVLYATSTMNEHPEQTPRPFDLRRDGLVVGEGAATLVLESLDHARARGAPVLAELTGFATNSDGNHVTRPDRASMRRVMEQALAAAGVEPSQIGYVSAHGTATGAGDIAESNATADLFGDRVPVASLKSYTGHTLGACGAIEAWLSIEMMREGWFAPNLNLDEVDPACGDLDYIRDEGRSLKVERVMSNNFAFGGINTSLVFERLSD
ncbi:MAG: beta-ketoacyl-ACP synthase [Xanthomonadales bacterium]|jgi:3-oxoacyl-[acyl-carrier-protein] synthase II|nr:beta-ketoacyl-ACP synthase [Xanthomonadales bacterium]